MTDLEGIKFNDQGLVPTVVQDVNTGQVLMVAYMNREALEKTLATGRAHFFSRSRASIWEKGETSGNYQKVQEVLYDCDEDALLIKVVPSGPACHTGERSCFFRSLGSLNTASTTFPSDAQILERLYQVILDRKVREPAGSYVASLLQTGRQAIAKKVGEEAIEVILAGQSETKERLAQEIADLWFHSLILMAEREVSPQQVWEVLKSRVGRSGPPR